MAEDDPIDEPEEEGHADDAPGDPEAEEEFARPLDPEERESVEADLEDLESMKSVFEPQGAKGVVIACTECGSNHFYGWELLKESLEHMLETGEPRMHEPPYQPREDDYVVWDYGKGYVDALADAGLDSGEPVDLSTCAWCDGTLEPHFAFCPQCGRQVAVIRLYRELLGRGIEDKEARTLLFRAGFEPFA
jgi:predicted nucleic-acid-binding Zn-ribbon protein